MIQIKINKPIPGYRIDQKLNVEADSNGVPLDIFWRRRLKDAETDQCCEVVKPAKKKIDFGYTKENK